MQREEARNHNLDDDSRKFSTHRLPESVPARPGARRRLSPGCLCGYTTRTTRLAVVIVEHASLPDSNTSWHLVRASRRELPGFMGIPRVFFAAGSGREPGTIARAFEWNMVTQGLLATDLNSIFSSTVLRDIPGAVMQPQEWRSRSERWCIVEDGAWAQLAGIREWLEEQGSETRSVCPAGTLPDLLPPRSVETEAVRSPVETLGIDPGIVITDDDTGNDLDMMDPDLGFRSIAVVNAGPERCECRVPNICHASAPFSTGVQEGPRHHGWLPEQATCNGTGTSATKGCSHGQN